MIQTFSSFLQDQESEPMISFKTLVDFINRNDYTSLKNFLENRHCNVDDSDEDKSLTALMVAAAAGKHKCILLFSCQKRSAAALGITFILPFNCHHER